MPNIDSRTRRRGVRARRAADRHGLVVVESRTRNTNAYDHGRYVIVDQRANAVVAGFGPVGYTLDLDDVEEYLGALSA